MHGFLRSTCYNTNIWPAIVFETFFIYLFKFFIFHLTSLHLISLRFDLFHFVSFSFPGCFSLSLSSHFVASFPPFFRRFFFCFIDYAHLKINQRANRSGPLTEVLFICSFSSHFFSECDSDSLMFLAWASTLLLMAKNRGAKLAQKMLYDVLRY